METIIIVMQLACFLAMVYCLFMMYKTKQEIKKLNELKKRNAHLYDYRLKILYKDKTLYDKLPSYEEMLNSNKPLEDKYWLNAT